METQDVETGVFAEIEVTRDTITIRRKVSQMTCALLLEIANDLGSTRASWDGNISADHAYTAAEAVSDAIRRAVSKIHLKNDGLR